MLKKIFRASSLSFLYLSLSFSVFFSLTTSVMSAQITSDSSENNSMGIVIEETTDAFDGTKTSEAPDLGDDQAFPFIPGFGKNSGKD
tara:strand:- start:148 stop:408 length:261 start_codon:yes stop_codon:yes gene_type:complete